MNNKLFQITDKEISIEAVANKVFSPNAGAITTFIGTVREFTKGKRTLYLEYASYITMAEKKLSQIGDEIIAKWPNAKVAITHRIGRLDISDIAVVIAVSTPHRNDAYKANQYAIERIKQIVPIWKKEHWENGDSWIGDQLEKKAYPNGSPEEELLND